VLPTEGSTPASARRSVYLMETYWLPLSLWCTSLLPCTGRRSWRACSRASRTKLGMRRPAHPPADDPAGIGVDDKGDIDEAGPGRDVGEVGDPQHVRPPGHGTGDYSDREGMAPTSRSPWCGSSCRG